MAKTSFTLRTSSGSAIQLEASNDTTTLRGDAYTSVSDALVTEEESFFSAVAIDYGQTRLQWGIGTALTTPTTATPVPTEVHIRWDTVGEPQTVSNGVQVAVITSQNVVSSIDHGDLPEGRWVYYSLFVKYEGVGTVPFFDRAASLSVLIPTNYNSKEMLYRRISQYWRSQDVDDSAGISSSSDLFGYGPLYRMMDVFGWDIDTVRTHAHHLMVGKDPQYATSEALDALAYEMGVPLRSVDLGTERLRNILNDIGYLRQSKGTSDGVREWLTAISGADVDIRYTRSNLLSASNKRFLGTLTNTTNGALVPTGASTWVFESASCSASAAPGGGVDIVRSSGTGYITAVAKCAVTNVKNSSWHRVLFDVKNQSGASVFGAQLSTTLYEAADAYTNASTGWVEPPDGAYTSRISDGVNNWYQVPMELGLTGDGTFTTSTMYLHIYLVFGPGTSSIRLDNVNLYNDDRYPYEIDIMSHRVNMCRDPQFLHQDSTQWAVSSTGGSAGSYYGSLSLSASSGIGASVSFYTVNHSPVKLGVKYYASVFDRYNNVEKVEVVSAQYGVIATATDTSAEYPYSNGAVRKVWEVTREYVAPWLPQDLTDCYIRFTAVVGAGSTASISAPLWEYTNSGGMYFDGNNPYGGWLPGDSVGTGVADYRWGASGESDSFSYYTSDYQRTVAALYRVLDKLIPVTQTDSPSSLLNLNCIYGYTGSTLL